MSVQLTPAAVKEVTRMLTEEKDKSHAGLRLSSRALAQTGAGGHGARSSLRGNFCGLVWPPWHTVMPTFRWAICKKEQ